MKFVAKTLALISFLLGLACAHSSHEDFVIKELPETSESKKEEKSDLYISIAQSLESHGKLLLATENYQSALLESPKNAKAHFFYGKILLKRMFLSAGLQEINLAIKLDPDFTEARNFLAYYYYNQKKLNKAFKHINLSAKDLTYSNQEEIWALKLNLDLVFKGRGVVSLATARKATATKPQKCINRVSIAKSLLKMRLHEESLLAARQAEGLCAKDTTKMNKLKYLKSNIFISRGHFVVAKSILESIQTEDKELKKRIPQLLISINKKMETD